MKLKIRDTWFDKALKTVGEWNTSAELVFRIQYTDIYKDILKDPWTYLKETNVIYLTEALNKGCKNVKSICKYYLDKDLRRFVREFLYDIQYSI